MNFVSTPSTSANENLSLLVKLLTPFYSFLSMGGQIYLHIIHTLPSLCLSFSRMPDWSSGSEHSPVGLPIIFQGQRLEIWIPFHYPGPGERGIAVGCEGICATEFRLTSLHWMTARTGKNIRFRRTDISLIDHGAYEAIWWYGEVKKQNSLMITG